MTPRAPVLAAAAALALLGAAPALAQAPDFGDDSNPWANDGECDDPRFTGPGMAAALLDSGVMTDAADCRAAFEAGTVQLAEGAAPTPPKDGPSADPVQPPPEPAAVDFGNDSSQWANDGECDDRRFVGQGMATALSWENTGRDATDCRGLFEAGSIRAWDWPAARAATQCASIDFGDDASEYANSGVCDDPRFDGLAMDSVITEAESGHDASDCSQLCTFGVIALRQ